MNIIRYMVISKSERRFNDGSDRITKNKPALQGNEIAIRVDLSVPDELFKKPMLQASITMPKDAVSAPVIDADIVDNIQETISKQLGVELTISVPEIEQ